MKILAIETSSARGSVALLDDDRVLAEKSLGTGSRHGRDLVPCADEILGGDTTGVDLLAVSAGPGSYTGLRVGITFAKTFATQTQTPAVTVSSLDVIAGNVAGPRPLCVVVDARLGQVYAAFYDGDRKKLAGDLAASPEEVAGRLKPGTIVIGEVIDDESTWWPRATNVGRLGRAKFAENGGEDPHALMPRYLRRPQAEVKWEESQSASGPK